MPAADARLIRIVDAVAHLGCVKVAGFGPMNSRIGHLDDQERFTQSVGDVYLAHRLPAIAGRTGTENPDVAGVLRCLAAVPFRPARERRNALAIQQRKIVRTVPWLVAMELPVDIYAIQIRQQQHPPTIQRPAVLVGHVGRRITAMGAMVHVEGFGDIRQLVATSRADGFLGPRRGPIEDCQNQEDTAQPYWPQCHDLPYKESTPPSPQTQKHPKHQHDRAKLRVPQHTTRTRTTTRRMRRRQSVRFALGVPPPVVLFGVRRFIAALRSVAGGTAEMARSIKATSAVTPHKSGEESPHSKGVLPRSVVLPELPHVLAAGDGRQGLDQFRGNSNLLRKCTGSVAEGDVGAAACAGCGCTARSGSLMR